jgi:hypothetical protein
VKGMYSSSVQPVATGPNRSTAFWRGGIFFILAFTVWGCLGDHFFHVRTGTLTYHWAPMIDGQSVAVAGFFLFLAVVGWVGYWRLAAFWDGAAPPSWGYVAYSLVAMTAVYAASGQYGDSHHWVFFWAAAGLLAVRVVAEGRGHLRATLLACLFLLGGWFAEGVVIYMGMFDYARPDVFGMPAWLIVQYPHGAFFGLACARKARTAR